MVKFWVECDLEEAIRFVESKVSAGVRNTFNDVSHAIMESLEGCGPGDAAAFREDLRLDAVTVVRCVADGVEPVEVTMKKRGRPPGSRNRVLE